MALFVYTMVHHAASFQRTDVGQDTYHYMSNYLAFVSSLLIFRTMNAAGLAKAAEKANKHWDSSLTPPTLRWGPNPVGTPGPQPWPATEVYTPMAGLPGPGIHHPHYYCDDRQYEHGPPGPLGAPLENQQYCANTTGPYPWFAAPPPPPHGWRKRCARADLNLHPAGWAYRMCRMCTDQTREQAWYRHMERDFTGISVGRLQGVVLPLTLPRLLRLPDTAARRNLALNQPIAKWRRFLTHLCRACEKEERIKLHFRLPGGPGTPAVGAPTESFKMLSASNRRAWPWITCTCRHELFRDEFDDTDYCLRHRHIRAGRRHDFLLHTRQQNDQWLRETKLQGGLLVRASDADVAQRATMKIFRACRCGKDIVPDGHVVRVAMCLGCEGIAHLRHNNLPIPGRWLAAPRYDMRPRGPYPLRRRPRYNP
jgi:hypothetical protein